MVIFLVGPTASGKSTLAKRVCADTEWRHEKLDRLVAGSDPSAPSGYDNWIPFWRESVNHIQRLEREYAVSDDVCIVDVGAGTLQRCEAYGFFRDRAGQLIYIWAPADIVFERARRCRAGIWAGKTLDQFRSSEFSENRRKIYELASKQVDTSKSVTESEVGLKEAIRCIVRKP